ncbi:MAG: 1,2-phenylacetyl-CoA epoxidase subunit PaaC, partial [Ktedonobacterales bacterium]
MPATPYSPETTQALYDLLARLADTKSALGRDYAEWCSGAPTLESAVAAAAMAQDELGHARALYPLLRTLALEAGPETDPETRTAFVNHAFVSQPFATWEDFITANFLVDVAMTTIFAAAAHSSYEPLAGRSRKALQEEQLHTVHGEAWVRRLSNASAASKDALTAALRATWDETLCWFGPQEVHDPLAEARILDATPEQLRARYLATVGPTIVAAGLDLPVRPASAGSGYELAAALPWPRWD